MDGLVHQARGFFWPFLGRRFEGERERGGKKNGRRDDGAAAGVGDRSFVESFKRTARVESASRWSEW